MSECTDKRFRDILHAYELHLLSDEERRELEMHLLDCPPCRKELLELQETIALLRQDDDVREVIERLGREEEEKSEETIEIEPRKRRRLLPTLVPATVLALVVVFILVLKPWQIEISPSQEAIAAKNRLAIMYFDNISDPTDSLRLGQILTNLLITDLAESHYIQVVSHQRLYDILKLLNLEDIRRIDAETATRIAERAGAQWMLMGTILQMHPQLIVTAQLVEVKTGNVVASQRVTGAVDETVFSLVDQLSAEIKGDLSLPAAAEEEVDRPVAEVTSHSTEAYRLYLEGVDDWYKFYFNDAIDKFEQALDHDSTLAMAYYYLAIIQNSKWIKKAVQYSERASQKEQLYIKSRSLLFEGKSDEAIDVLRKMVVRFPDEKLAYFILGTLYYSIRDYDSSIEAEKNALAIDPHYAAALNQLAYSYQGAGDTINSFETIDKYIALAPDEPNPYDSRGDLLQQSGKYKEAIASYKMAVQKKSDFINSLDKIVLVSILIGDYATAKEYTRKFIAKADSARKWTSPMHYVYIPQYQGKFKETIAVIDSIIAEMKKTLGDEDYSTYRHIRSVVHAEQGHWDEALTDMNKAINISRRVHPKMVGDYLDLYAQTLAESGRIERAIEIADSLKIVVKDELGRKSDYDYAMGTIELARGNNKAAIDYLEEASKKTTGFSFSIHYQLGRAYLKADMPEKAVKEFESLKTERMSIYYFYWGIWAVKSYYYSGLAYEELGKTDQAIKSYTEFLNIWKNADPGIPEMDDARARLARLQTKS